MDTAIKTAIYDKLETLVPTFVTSFTGSSTDGSGSLSPDGTLPPGITVGMAMTDDQNLFPAGTTVYTIDYGPSAGIVLSNSSAGDGSGVTFSVYAIGSSFILKGVSISDIRKSVLDQDIPAFPWAFVMPASVESSALLDDHNVERVYSFDVLVIQSADNLASDTAGTSLETLREAILDKLDNDPTLGGAAVGGVPPTSSNPFPFQHAGRDVVGFGVTLKANGVKLFTWDRS